MKIALVCGEASGDALGAGLARAIAERNPDAELMGVTGPKMREAGVRSWMDCKAFSVMGYLDAISRVGSLLRSRRELLLRIGDERPDVYVGIDAPDLNLGLGRSAKIQGARRYVQYVCPSFWAWRKERAEFLSRHCNLVLNLFPFEAAHCEQAGITHRFVGHRLADEIPAGNAGREAARRELGIDDDAKVLAMLPGSRDSEIFGHVFRFAKVANLCLIRMPGLEVLWAPSEGLRDSLPKGKPWKVHAGKARTVLAAADAALVKSGTITLEAALLGCPQMIAYHMGAVGGWLAKRRLGDIHSRFYGLPNLLAGRRIAPEYIQDRAVPNAMAPTLVSMLEGEWDVMREDYDKIREALGTGADAKAAEAVLELAG